MFVRKHKVKNYEKLSEKAAFFLASQITLKPESVIGLATGSTPIGTYSKLIEMNEKWMICFEKVTSFNLDEYCDLPIDHPESYHSFMDDKLFKHININIENIHILNGNCEDPEKEAEAYELAIEAAGGIDMQILGIGHDGHIGFNMPGQAFPVKTHVVELTDMTIQANARFFDNSIENVPKKAITLGIGAIMNAKHILLLANGPAKMEILSAAMNGPVTPEVPASILQLHNNVDVIYCE